MAAAISHIASCPERLELLRFGEVIQTVRPEGDGSSEIKLDMKLDANHGCWLAIRSYATNDTKVHTTPVYVRREGLRWWKFDEVEDLLAKRFNSLKEVEEIVADAKAKLASGETTADQTLKELAEQGDDLLKRIELARKIYEKLRKTAEKEREARLVAE